MTIMKINKSAKGFKCVGAGICGSFKQGGQEGPYLEKISMM